MLNFLFLFFTIGLFGQKVEKESGIGKSLAPAKAQAYIDQTALEKVNWYKEEGLNTISFEAKFKFNKRWFSVEFSEEGELEDIEIEIDLEDVPNEPKEAILAHLGKEFDKFKVRKVQIQYKATTLQALLNEGIPQLNSAHAFEIVVKGKKAKVTQLWELAFSSQGELISIDQVITRTSTHIEY